MGDRGNIVVEDDGKRVYFYTHWRGSELREILQAALGRRQRWNDPSYLARIIFCEMVKGDEDGETGFGISTTIGDNEHDLLVVIPRDHAVVVETERGQTVHRYTFEQFLGSAS